MKRQLQSFHSLFRPSTFTPPLLETPSRFCPAGNVNLTGLNSKNATKAAPQMIESNKDKKYIQEILLFKTCVWLYIFHNINISS